MFTLDKLFPTNIEDQRIVWFLMRNLEKASHYLDIEIEFKIVNQIFFDELSIRK